MLAIDFYGNSYSFFLISINQASPLSLTLKSMSRIRMRLTLYMYHIKGYISVSV